MTVVVVAGLIATVTTGVRHFEGRSCVTDAAGLAGCRRWRVFIVVQPIKWILACNQSGDYPCTAVVPVGQTPPKLSWQLYMSWQFEEGAAQG